MSLFLWNGEGSKKNPGRPVHRSADGHERLEPDSRVAHLTNGIVLVLFVVIAAWCSGSSWTVARSVSRVNASTEGWTEDGEAGR